MRRRGQPKPMKMLTRLLLVFTGALSISGGGLALLRLWRHPDDWRSVSLAPGAFVLGGLALFAAMQGLRRNAGSDGGHD